MSTLVIIILGLILLMTILSPFLSKKSEQKSTVEQGFDLQEKEHIFSQLADLEYDYQMDKLSTSDYNKTKSELTAKAAKFVQPTQSISEQIKIKVDVEINNHLKKSGLEPKSEVNYEN